VPSTGRLVRYQPPAASDRVRVDTGVMAGGEITRYYDPMIAKLITWGESRDEAIRTMRHALDNYLIEGPGHNIDFLNAVMAHPRFQSGNLSTGFIAEEYPNGYAGIPLREETTQCFAIVAACIERAEEAMLAPLPSTSTWVVTVDNETVHMSVAHRAGHDVITLEDGTRFEVAEAYRPGMRLATFVIAGHPWTVQIRRLEYGYLLTHGGQKVTAVVRTPRLHELARRMPAKRVPDTSKLLTTPMPGLVRQVMVVPGQKVTHGQTLFLLEAMKMENPIYAEKDGIVETVHVRADDTVEAEAVLVTFK
jgi:propionyl-CoA carboxylase alpha chain